MNSLRRFWAVWFVALVGAAMMAEEMPVARDIGVPVKGVNWVRLHAGATAAGEASLLITMGQNNGGLIVLDVDLETGHCR